MKAKLSAGFVTLVLSLSAVAVNADEGMVGIPSGAQEQQEEQVTFSPEYLEQVNMEKQMEDAQREKDRVRHQKYLDFASRRR